MPNFNVACINQCTEAEGPGKRLAIWFQGCTKQCPGCCNPQFFEIKPAHILSLEKVCSIINEAKENFDIEGVTYLGGEPTLQTGLALLSEEISKMGLGIIMLTGYNYEELSEDLKKAADLIIDGGFEIDKIDNERNLMGSANQRLIFVTDRYKASEDWFFSYRPKRVEINVLDELFLSGDKIL